VQSEVIRVLEADPDLAEDLDPAARALAARRGLARVEVVERGRWQVLGATWHPRGHLGLLVLDGFIARTVHAGNRTCAELLGPGDFLRPWVKVSAESSVPFDSGLEVLERTRLAVLDRRFAQAVNGWPEVTAAILDRMTERSRWLAFHLTVSHLRRVDARLLVALWHLGDRWGRMQTDGLALEMPLTHQLLAEIVGAERPSVTVALGRLGDRGLVERRGPRSWLLRGGPPDELEHVRDQSRGRPAAAV
jgi:CRP/FNR family transcriptional regulator, cyclic AMP receptor protein